MKKCSVFVGALLFASLFIAGDVFAYNYSYSPSFVRTMSRAASGDVDSIYYNPVGTVKLQDGLYLDLGDQLGAKTYSHRVGTEFRTYSDTTPAFTIPNLGIVYKKGGGSVHVSLYIPGGGGSVNYNAPVGGMSTVSYLLNKSAWTKVNGTATVPTTGTLGVNTIKGSSFWMQLQGGGAFKLNDHMSLTAGIKGARYTGWQSAGVIKLGTVMKNEYEAMGFCGFAGVMISASKIDFTVMYNTITIARGTNNNLKNQWRSAYENRLDDYVLVGINVKPTEKMSISASYQLTLSGEKKLGSTRNLMARSLELAFNDPWALAAAPADTYAVVYNTVTYNLPTTQVAGNVQNFKKKMGHMAGLGVEYDLGKVVLSLGIQYAAQDVMPRAQNPLDPNLTKIGGGLGFKFKATETVSIELGAARYFYLTQRILFNVIKMNKEVWSAGLGLTAKVM